MADEADIANDHVQKTLDLTMRTINTKVPENDKRICIWCEGKIKEKDGRRWCSLECRQDHQLYANNI